MRNKLAFFITDKKIIFWWWQLSSHLLPHKLTSEVVTRFSQVSMISNDIFARTVKIFMPHMQYSTSYNPAIKSFKTRFLFGYFCNWKQFSLSWYQTAAHLNEMELFLNLSLHHFLSYQKSKSNGRLCFYPNMQVMLQTSFYSLTLFSATKLEFCFKELWSNNKQSFLNVCDVTNNVKSFRKNWDNFEQDFCLVLWSCGRAGMSNWRPAGHIRPHWLFNAAHCDRFKINNHLKL